MRTDYSKFYQKLGYTFQDEQLIGAALTHRSVKGNNNERLEFLGDSILNFIIAEALYVRYENALEGELSRLRAALVRGDTLAAVAIELDLGNFLRLGPGELKTGGQRRGSILADGLEATIAAIYLDGGIKICTGLVLNWFADRLASVSKVAALKDPKTRLQEFLQAHKYPLPCYDITDTEGDSHNQTFTIKCQVDGLSLSSEGRGTSRRRAEQQAAKAFLEALAVA